MLKLRAVFTALAFSSLLTSAFAQSNSNATKKPSAHKPSVTLNLSNDGECGKGGCDVKVCSTKENKCVFYHCQPNGKCLKTEETKEGHTGA